MSSKLRGMFDHIHQPHYLFTAPAGDQGFIVAEVDTERGNRFSITGSIYSSKAAYELGNENAVHTCGCIHEDIEKYVPALAPFIPLHLSYIETGEPDNLKNALYFIKPQGATAHELQHRKEHGNRNHWSSPDDESQVHNYFVGLAANILRIKDAETLTTMLLEHANEWLRVNDPDDDEPFDSISVIYEPVMSEAFEALVMHMAPAWREQAVEFSLWLEQQPAPEQTPSDQPSEEFAHKFDNGLSIKATIEDDEAESPIMNGEYVFRYTVVVKLDGKRRTFHPTGSVADYWQGHKDAKGAAWGILRELGSIYNEGEEFWEQIEVDPQSAQARKGDADAEIFGEAIQDNMDVIGI